MAPLRLLPNGHGQILHQVGKFLKIARVFYLFLQPDLFHQLFDDLVELTIILSIAFSALFVGKIILTQFLARSRRHFWRRSMFSLSEKSQSSVVLLYVVLKVGHTFASPANFGRSMPRTCRAKSHATSILFV
jgi:hypothetical protein